MLDTQIEKISLIPSMNTASCRKLRSNVTRKVKVYMRTYRPNGQIDRHSDRPDLSFYQRRGGIKYNAWSFLHTTYILIYRNVSIK